MATTLLKVDVSKVQGLGERLGKLSGEEIAQATVTALNDVVGSTYDITRKRMVSQVNLDDPYIRGKMGVTEATLQKPKASIVAFGKREDEVPLSRYPNQLILAPRKTTGHQYNNKNRPYTGVLKLPEGMRQKAVQVSVSRQGGGATLLYAFMQPLRAGTTAGGNGFGIFARDRSGKKLHRYGPAVYQLFKTLIPQLAEEASDDLSTKLLDEVEAQIQKAFA
jgi:hypothetical protein